MDIRPGQVILTEGHRRSWISRAIAAIGKSWATHVFLVTGDDVAVEAVFPRVKALRVRERLRQLEAEDRAYVVLEFPNLEPDQRGQVADHAFRFMGRLYDVPQIFLYAVFRRFVKDGAGTLICSRLVTAAYHAAGITVFDDVSMRRYFLHGHDRMENLKRGFVTPRDLLLSRLISVHLMPSSRIKTLRDFVEI